MMPTRPDADAAHLIRDEAELRAMFPATTGAPGDPAEMARLDAELEEDYRASMS